MKIRSGAIAILAFATAALAACSSGEGDGNGVGTNDAGSNKNDITIAVVTHGSAGDAFWTIVKNGAEQAGRDLDVTVSYQGDGDPQKQSQLIDAAVNQDVNGLVVSMANPDALEESIRRAVEKGIPVITINSGIEKSAAFGALTHVGQDEIVAGQAAGRRLADAGVTHLVCLVHEAGNIGLEQRCQGAAETLGGTTENLQIDINNLAAAQATVGAKLLADPTVDGLLVSSSEVNLTEQAVDESGRQIAVGSFDLNADVADAVKRGTVLFGVDQQPYLQGYLPVTFLYLHAVNLNSVGGGLPVLTGPGFVTQETVDQVAELAATGTR